MNNGIRVKLFSVAKDLDSINGLDNSSQHELDDIVTLIEDLANSLK